MEQAVIELHFSRMSSYELVQTVFKPPYDASPVIGIRGNNAPPGVVSFRWSPTSQALAIFFVKARHKANSGKLTSPILEGIRACPASSIIRVMHKRTEGWVLDLFGADSNGRSLLMKIILSSNYLGKRPGPPQLFLRTNYLPTMNIKVIIDGEDISEDRFKIRALTKDLEKTWRPGAWPAERQSAAKNKVPATIKGDFPPVSDAA